MSRWGLLSAYQNSNYLSEINADLTVMLRGGKTLAWYRDFFQISVSLTKGEGIIVAGINSYLFKKARQHKEILDEILKKMTVAVDPEGPASRAMTR